MNVRLNILKISLSIFFFTFLSPEFFLQITCIHNPRVKLGHLYSVGVPLSSFPAETKKESDLVRFFPYLLPSLLIFHQARWGELYSHGWGGSVKWEHESSLAPMEILKQMLAQEFVGALARQVYGELFITVLGHWSFFGGGWRPLSP